MNSVKEKHHKIPNEVVKRLDKIFRCVKWIGDGEYDGYFDKPKKGITLAFIKNLINKADSNETDYKIVNCFYCFKKKVFDTKLVSAIKKQKKDKVSIPETPFDHILPPEKAFEKIEEIEFNKHTADPEYEKGGYYYLFNNCYIEQNFKQNLENNLQLIISSGDFFPLYKHFNNEWEKWVCQYDNQHTRFIWIMKEVKDVESRDVVHPTVNPWRMFTYYCQRFYTLARIGFENSEKKGLSLSEYCEIGQKKIYYFLEDYFKNMKKKANKDHRHFDEEVEWQLLEGNLRFGLEERYEQRREDGKKNVNTNLDKFHINSYEEAKAVIISCKNKKKYEKAFIYTFTSDEFNHLHALFVKYKKDIKDSFKVDQTSIIEVIEFLHKNREKLSNRDEKTITRLYREKYLPSRPLSFDYKNEDGEDFYNIIPGYTK